MAMKEYFNELVKADEVRREKEERRSRVVKYISEWLNLVFWVWVIMEVVVILRMM